MIFCVFYKSAFLWKSLIFLHMVRNCRKGFPFQSCTRGVCVFRRCKCGWNYCIQRTMLYGHKIGAISVVFRTRWQRFWAAGLITRGRWSFLYAAPLWDRSDCYATIGKGVLVWQNDSNHPLIPLERKNLVEILGNSAVWPNLPWWLPA